MALANQLRAELERFWPGPIGLFSDLDSQISLAFLERYPSPVDARGLGEQRLAAFLARERYSGRKPPAELLAKLDAARPRAAPASSRRRPAARLVLALVAALEPIVGADQRARAADRPRLDASIPTGRSSARCSATRNSS